MADRRGSIVMRGLIRLPYLWLLLFALLPWIIVLKVSLSETAVAMPPYRPLFSGLELFFERLQQFTFGNYADLLGGLEYPRIILSSIMIAALSTIVTLLIGYPVAYSMSRAPGRLRHALLLMVILVFATSMLVRSFAWVNILSAAGLLNQILLSTGAVSEPLVFLNTDLAVHIAMVYSYLPLMILPLYASFVNMDRALLEAAVDLGATPFRAFRGVTLPQSRQAIACGCLLVFVPAAGNFIIPDMLGGPGTAMIGKTLWADFSNRNWPFAAAAAVVLIAVLAVPIILFARTRRRGIGVES